MMKQEENLKFEITQEPLVPVQEPEVDNTKYEWHTVAKARRRGYSYMTGSGLAAQLQNSNTYEYQELTLDRMTEVMQEMFAQRQETNNQSVVGYTGVQGERMLRDVMREELTRPGLGHQRFSVQLDNDWGTDDMVTATGMAFQSLQTP